MSELVGTKVTWSTKSWGQRMARVEGVSPNRRVLTLQLTGPAGRFPAEYPDGEVFALVESVKAAPPTKRKAA